MTWPPQQDPCTEPCCTGGDLDAPAPETPPRPGPLRECGVAGCIHCDLVWPAPGGGDRLPTRSTNAST